MDWLARAGGFWARQGGHGYGRTRLYLPGARYDYEREAGDLWSNAVVALSLSWLGDRFPRPTLRAARLGRNGEYRPIGRHPVVDLWSRPNPYYTRRTMEKAVGLSIKCDGNAYIYKLRDKMGRVAQLWWIPHYRIAPTWPSDGSAYIDGYRIQTDSGFVDVSPADVVHIRDGIDPRNERLGLAALKSCVRDVCTVNLEGSYTAALLKNSGVPGLMVIPRDANLRPSQDEADAMKKRIHDFYSVDNAGSALIAAGQYDVQTVGYSPEQLRLDSLPQTAVSRIAASIGVAPMSVGLPDPGKTYANLSEANKVSWGSIVAVQELIDETLRWDLLPEFGDDPAKTILERDYSQIQELQESLDAVHTRTREDFRAGLITRAVAQEQLGYDVDDEYGGMYYPGAVGGDQAVAPDGGEDLDQ